MPKFETDEEIGQKVPFCKGLLKSAFSFARTGILVELLRMFGLELTFSYG